MPSPPDKLRIVVGGLAGLYPVGGVAWDYLEYVVGLAGLGHDVVYHEDTWSWPYHPIERSQVAVGDYSARFIGDFFTRYAPALSERWHYLHLRETSFGMRRAAFDEFARDADLFLNVSGACMIPEALPPRCVKVFLDTDPGYNQIVLSERPEWSENVERWCASVRAHDRHFTYAENIHGEGCSIPRLDFDWRTTRMPVVLDLWEEAARREPAAGAPWTTVMTWNAFKGDLVHRGVRYQSKGAEFEKLLDLPARSRVPLCVALGGVGAPGERVARHGWRVEDGPSATRTPERFREFIVGSRGELSAAKHVYVAMRSGWFSGRSARYLASARPVVVEDTGFAAALPVGEGILAFHTAEEAAAAIAEVERDYPRHRRAARAIAEEYFDSKRVLGRLVEEAMAVHA